MRRKKQRWMFWTLLVLATIILYLLVYLCFRGNVGFPVGTNLTKGDWLSFFGNYLCFASSTLLAIVVFQQDRKINDLLSSEYDPVLVIKVVEYERLFDDEVNRVNSRFIVIEKEKQKLLFEQFIFDPETISNNDECMSKPFRLYLIIHNKGKLPIHSLTINRIELDGGSCLYTKDIDEKQVEVKTIQASGVKNVCIRLDKFPKIEDEQVHTLRIYYSVSLSKNIMFDAEYEVIYTGDESTLYDGVDYHRK